MINFVEARGNLLKLIFFLFFIGSEVLLAQNQIPNLQEVNVDELTEEQIQAFITRAESSGYSEAQLEMLARARGMSEADISKLRERIYQAQGNEGSSGNGVVNRLRQNNNSETFSQQTYDVNRRTVLDPFEEVYQVDTITDDQALSIYGKSFFENLQNNFESSLNVAAPKDYLLGPGDEIIIDIWGASEKSFSLYISPEGSVFIPDLGPLYLNGYDLKTAEERIKQRLKSIFSNLGENTFAQLTLGQLRSISVNVVGEVENPGTFSLSAFSSIINALIQGGGPNDQGSFRDIKLFRRGSLVTKIDLYEFFINGDDFTSLKLQDQDIIIVPPFINRITLTGELKRPAHYEMIPGETLLNALEYSGGFAPNAYRKSISLRRSLDNKKTVKTVVNDDFGIFEVKSGDVIDVGAIQSQFTKRVRVEGAVNHPGEFEIADNMTLSQAIQLSDGFRGDAYMDRALVIRELPNFELQSVAFSPKELMAGNYDLILEEEDLIQVQSIFDLQEKYKVNIQGEVLNPGNYPFAEGLTVEDVIFLAGGFKESAAKSFVEVARRVNENNSEEQNVGDQVSEIFRFAIDDELRLSTQSQTFNLRPFDMIVIRRSAVYEKQAVIEVEGEILYPGKYVLEKRDERISDVLNRAGGLTKYAYTVGATLIRRTEYFVNSEDDDLSDETSIAAKIRKRELEDLFQNDTQVEASKQKFKTQESIGINLDKVLDNPGGAHDLILKEGDVISIPQEMQTVRVRGEVLYPSTIRYSKDLKLRDFVSNAGGFTDNALRRKSYVIYPNGSAEKSASFFGIKNYPSVLPGSEIIIPSRPEKRKLTPGEITSIAIGLATLGNLIINITR